MPICELAGQRPTVNSASSHVGVACGLPMKPVGKCWMMTRASSQPQTLLGGASLPSCLMLSSHSIVSEMSGWPPAWVVDGPISKTLIPS